jgi:hypothetical protein
MAATLGLLTMEQAELRLKQFQDGPLQIFINDTKNNYEAAI